ncbi:hypothetical protein Poli38472_010543 [Pythium oligandrum]|uniref:Uncharacterized protein n=1 Tax=Pythium oligandrum TaxID=41045 RepID=A0A8K1C3A1_PYTOL|nr:hypothetical protein Poli38472_010543 [Pythium oligandrum]|eukprot:TMW55661.1 hypothetical protein Poli38472_010543 [Pythium oligandrum]
MEEVEAHVEHAASSIAPEILNEADATLTKKRKFLHTSEAQRRCILEWLEQGVNFQLLTAPASVAVVTTADGKRFKKTDGFRALMRFVNDRTQAGWTMETTKSRYESLLTTYRKAKALTAHPETAITANDRARGITELNQKLNAVCSFYDRIDALFNPSDPAEGHEANGPVESDAEQSLAALSDTKALVNPAEDEDVAALGVKRPRKRAKSETSHVESGNEHDPIVAVQPLSEEIVLQQIAIEREKVELQQAQLLVQKQELELRERELRLQEEERRQSMRAEIVSKLILAGKSAEEIKEYLAIVEQATL